MACFCGGGSAFSKVESDLYSKEVFFATFRYETVTKTDIDHVRNHIMNHAVPSGNPTKRPDHHSEEHTNVIPHIPNYWTPSEETVISHSSEYAPHHVQNYRVTH